MPSDAGGCLQPCFCSSSSSKSNNIDTRLIVTALITCVCLLAILQHEMIPGVSKDQEALLIALKRPIIFVLPAAFDKGNEFLVVKLQCNTTAIS